MMRARQLNLWAGRDGEVMKYRGCTESWAGQMR